MEKTMSDKATVESLNKALQREMSAAHHYQLHAHVLDDWGLNLPADMVREEQAEEIGQFDLFIERILLLEGTPEIAFAKSTKRAETLIDMFKDDLADEKEATESFLSAARQAHEANDVGSRMLLERIAMDEEGHKAWSELQLEFIERIGHRAYSAKLVSVMQDEDPST